MKREIIFQAFNWRLNDVLDHLPYIAHQGFTMIQLSPLQQHKEPENPIWFLGYQPTNFRIGNRLGCREELVTLCEESKKYGVKIIVDCVFNHVANACSDDSLVPSMEVEREIRERPDFFHEKRATENYEDRYQCTQWGINLPDLNTANHSLQDMMIAYLKDLQSCGVVGFRMDAVKHIELPGESYSGSDFWCRVLSSLEKRENLFIYGEILFADTWLVDQYAEYMLVGVNNGKGSQEEKKVRWTFSHDDYLTFNLARPNAGEVLLDEWDYLLYQHRESHVLFYPHSYQDIWKMPRMRDINHRLS